MNAQPDTSNPQPLVSVIVPVYNSQDFLRETIDSVFAQRYEGPFQVIAVDDGSTDSSVDVLNSYGGRVEVYSQANAGSAAARNLGIQKAKGEFVAFLDADDVWHPDKTRLQVAHLQANDEIGLVFASLMFARPQQYPEISEFLQTNVDSNVSIVESSSGWLYTKFIDESLLQTSSVIMRRSLVEEVGFFDVELRKGQDYDYWLRASRQSQFHKLEPVLSVYRLNDEGITQKPSAENYGAIIIERALRRWGRAGPDGAMISALDVRRRLSGLWFEFGYLHDKKGDPRHAASGYFRAWRYQPWRLRAALKASICALRSLLTSTERR